MVGDGEDVILIESGGVIIRMPASDINVYKRDTQGVILMRVEGDSQVIGVEKVDNQEETPWQNGKKCYPGYCTTQVTRS